MKNGAIYRAEEVEYNHLETCRDSSEWDLDINLVVSLSSQRQEPRTLVHTLTCTSESTFERPLESGNITQHHFT